MKHSRFTRYFLSFIIQGFIMEILSNVIIFVKIFLFSAMYLVAWVWCYRSIGKFSNFIKHSIAENPPKRCRRRAQFIWLLIWRDYLFKPLIIFLIIALVVIPIVISVSKLVLPSYAFPDGLYPLQLFFIIYFTLIHAGLSCYYFYYMDSRFFKNRFWMGGRFYIRSSFIHTVTALTPCIVLLTINCFPFLYNEPPLHQVVANVVGLASIVFVMVKTKGFSTSKAIEYANFMNKWFRVDSKK